MSQNTQKPKVFYSFHYDGDAWRTQTVRKIGALDKDEPVEPNKWEEIKKGGDQAIEKWIDGQLKGKDCLVVLVGAETASRPWVRREIEKAWDNYIPVIGIRIHGLLDPNQKAGKKGDNPFDKVKLSGGSPLSTYLTLHDPEGKDSKEIYASIANNIGAWIKKAGRRTKVA